jgi:hypothetical protein
MKIATSVVGFITNVLLKKIQYFPRKICTRAKDKD